MDLYDKHRETVARAWERLEGKEAILHSWADREDVDPDYIRDLKKHIHQTKLRLLAMRPVGEENNFSRGNG